MSEADVKQNGVQVPSGLSAHGKKFYRDIATVFLVDDPGSRAVLFTAAQALDAMKAAQKEIRRDGLTILGRGGVRVRHPATTIEREARAGFLSAMRLLNLKPGEFDE